MSKPEDQLILISGTCLNDSYKGREFEGTIKIKPPKEPPKKSSIWDSMWIWLLLILCVNVIADDPLGFIKNKSAKSSPPSISSPE